MDYNEKDIQRHVSQAAYYKAEIYVAEDRVLNYAVSGDDIVAHVQGNERKPYRQQINISKSPGGTTIIAGSCTCPMTYNCKHVAAALLFALEKEQAAAPESPAEAVLRRISTILPRGVSPGFLGGLPDPSDTLPPDLEYWLKTLAKAQEVPSEDYPPEIAQRLIYLLQPGPSYGGMAALTFMAVSCRITKDGRLSKSVSHFNPRNLSSTPPKYLRPSDYEIIDLLNQLATRYSASNSAGLADKKGTQALQRMLATGRTRWLDAQGPVLQWGPPKDGRIVWRIDERANLRPFIEVDAGLVALAAQPPVYVDAREGLIGPIETELEPKVVAALLAAPPIAARHAPRLAEVMGERMPALAAVRPVQPKPPRIVSERPVPCLRLLLAQLPAQDPRYRNYQYTDFLPKEPVGLARLAFDYDGITVDASKREMRVVIVQDGGVVEVHRSEETEAAFVKALIERGFVPVKEMRFGVSQQFQYDLLPQGGELAWYDAMYHVIPELQRQGWRIDIDKDFPFRVVFGGGEIAAEVREGSGIDWLELDLGITIDGERIDLVPAILALISRGGHSAAIAAANDDQPFYLPLADGRLLALPAARLAPIVAALYELASGAGADSRSLRLGVADAAGLADFEEATNAAGLIWRGGEKLRAMGAKLRTAGGIPQMQLPQTFKGELRPYQAQGVAWLQFLRDVGLGGILADDMGLGKTVQALAVIAIEKAEGRLDHPVLIIAPTSLMANWRREAERFAPELKVLTLQGLERKKHFSEIPDNDIVLSTYPLLARDHVVLGAQAWHMVLLDEAQTVKNPDATTTKLLGKLDTRHRFCLTGTPLENHLGELWSLFSFAVPSFLGDRKSFTSAYRTPIEKKGDSERSRLLAKRIKPFLLRRTKSEVAKELPPKTEIAERVEFGEAQRDVYESIRLIMHDKVRSAIAEKGFARSRIIILDALLKLRQACCDPRLLKLKSGPAKTGSAKLERLKEMLEELVSEGRRILVFSQFTSMLELIRPELDGMDIRYSLLTGDTRDREPVIRGFQDGDIPVFLISLKAGGVGLNLTAADTVIIYDPWWNPAVEQQAIDRTHRIGQDKPVFVHRLMVQGSIEEKMEALKEKKRHLAESLFDADGAPTLAMTEEDIDLLLSAA